MSNVEFHVNGLAKLNFGSDYLGYSTEGVDVELRFNESEVMTDAWGDKVPEDVQNMGQDAIVSCELVKWDESTLQKVEKRFGSAGDIGHAPNVDDGGICIGTLLKQCEDYESLTIARDSNNLGCEDNPEGPYVFNCVYLMGVENFRLGTKVTRKRITFRCLPDLSGVLYTIPSA